ncbi:hypothetical protein BGC07_15175 [Piscirickettsia litoralis]|uniref:Uncharacterized protein n=1 Tax=Piscirickettsia litoralis TaxID=1891921 RepID=A0ABX2ZY11_9GAMM|nr:hypothetical protein BGC07_15175 [Piscirickettsia litoralis]
MNASNFKYKTKIQYANQKSCLITLYIQTAGVPIMLFFLRIRTKTRFMRLITFGTKQNSI